MSFDCMYATNWSQPDVNAVDARAADASTNGRSAGIGMNVKLSRTDMAFLLWRPANSSSRVRTDTKRALMLDSSDPTPITNTVKGNDVEDNNSCNVDSASSMLPHVNKHNKL
jgi:hypothetical protein